MGWVRATAPCQELLEIQVSDLFATDLTQENQFKPANRLQSGPLGSFEIK